MKNKLSTVKNHVVRNRAKYAALTTAVVLTAVHTRVVANVNEFLSEHNLLDEYYQPEA